MVSIGAAIEASADFYGIEGRIMDGPTSARRTAALILRYHHGLNLRQIASHLGYTDTGHQARTAHTLIDRATEAEWNTAALLLQVTA
jgi:hypothetical protein